MSYIYRPERRSAIRLDPSRRQLAAAVHLDGAWPHIIDAIRANLAAAREYLILSEHSPRKATADDLALEVIDWAGDLDSIDRYLLRLVLGQLCRDARSKARQNGNGHYTSKPTALPPSEPPANGPTPGGPFDTPRWRNWSNSQ